MRKILLVLFALMSVNLMYSQDKTTDDEVVIIYVLENTKPSGPTNRSAALSPVECSYHTMTSVLELSFRQNLGKAYVTLDNLSSGETLYYSCDSSFGLLRMPVDPDSRYALYITTESGRGFHASFVTSCQYDE